MDINKLEDLIEEFKIRNESGSLESEVNNYFTGDDFETIVLSMERYDSQVIGVIELLKVKYRIKSYEILEGGCWEEDTFGVLLKF